MSSYFLPCAVAVFVDIRNSAAKYAKFAGEKIMKNQSAYSESIGYHVVTIAEGRTVINYYFYLHLNTDEWMCIVETNIPNMLIRADCLN
jgi:hypothetical protein